MSIRRRLALSFLIILALFALDLYVYYWGSRQKSQSLTDLREAVERQFLLITIERGLEDRADEVTLVGDLLATTGAATLDAAQIGNMKKRLDQDGRVCTMPCSPFGTSSCRRPRCGRRAHAVGGAAANPRYPRSRRFPNPKPTTPQ
jgi:hypothetical protein